MRNTILIFIVVVIMLILGYGTLYSTGVTQGEFQAGVHYRELENPERRRPGAPIEVREFFSYACIHCKNFDPKLDEWAAGLPEGVALERTPVAFSPAWSLLAQAYLTLDYLDALDPNHARIFRQIHDRQTQFLSTAQLADFVDGHGVSSAEFLRAFDSPAVRRALGEADAAQRTFGITSVPTLTVAGKYTVSMDHGTKVALEIVDHLVAREQAVESEGAD